jgi:hypothetical protein
VAPQVSGGAEEVVAGDVVPRGQRATVLRHRAHCALQASELLTAFTLSADDAVHIMQA